MLRGKSLAGLQCPERASERYLWDDYTPEKYAEYQYKIFRARTAESLEIEAITAYMCHKIADFMFLALTLSTFEDMLEAGDLEHL